MTDTASSISRRTLAKGAAWTIPALSVVAAAPSLAASPTDECPDVAGWHEFRTSDPNFAVAASGVELTFGNISPNLNPPTGSNVARWTPLAVTAKDNNGVSHTGQIVDYTGNPFGISAPITVQATVAFDGFGPGWTQTHRLESYTVAYSIQWIQQESGSTTFLALCDYAADITATVWDADQNGGKLSSFY